MVRQTVSRNYQRVWGICRMSNGGLKRIYHSGGIVYTTSKCKQINVCFIDENKPSE